MSEEKKFNIFTFIDGISKKEYYYSEDTAKIYNQYMVNRGFSHFRETAHYANYLNMYPPRLDRMHHDFLYHIVPKKSRYAKWFKKDPLDDFIQEVAEYLQLSIPKTLEYVSLLNEEQKDDLKKSIDKGGL